MSVKMLFRLFGFWAATFALPVWSLNWTPVVDVSVMGQNASQSQIAIDPAGNATAVWVRFNGNKNVVQSASKPLGGSWTSPVDLSLTGQHGLQPQIAVDAAGNVTAIWIRSNGSTFIVQSSFKLLGGNWTSPVDLSSAGGNAFTPQVSVDPVGNATAIWRRNDGSNDIIQSASRLLTHSWTVPCNLSAAGQNAGEPQVAMDAAGNATAIWVRSNGSTFIVQSSFKSSQGKEMWTVPVNLSAVGQSSNGPQIVVDTNGNATAVWGCLSGSNSIIQSSYRPFEDSWTSPVNLSASGQNAFTAQIGVDTTGNVVAVWRRYVGYDLIAQSSSKPFKGSWTPPVNLSAIAQSVIAIQVAVDGTGNAIAVWSRFNGTNTVIQSASKLVGQNWTLPPVDLSTAGQNAAASAIVMNADGEAVVTWERSNGTNTIIQSTSTSTENGAL